MFKESFVLKVGDAMIYDLPSIFKFVKIFLSTGENQTFKIEKHEKLAKSFIINFGNFNIMIDSNDNEKVDSIFMPNNKVKFIEFLTNENSKKNYEDQTFKKPISSSSSSTDSNQTTFLSNKKDNSFCVSLPKLNNEHRLKIKYKVLLDFVRGSCYILQNCCSAWWLSRHPLMDGLDFIDCYILNFDSKSDMQHYIDSVYRPFALKQLQKGIEYISFKYHFTDDLNGSKASFYIRDLERQASKKELWKYFENYLVTRDGYCYPVKDPKEAFKIYSLQNKYNQNHDYVYSNEELDDYISLMKFFVVYYF
jgi:hypothetical protein